MTDPRFFRKYLEILDEGPPAFDQQNTKQAQQWAENNPKAAEYAKTGLDVATDFIPGVAQAKSAYRAGKAAIQGNYSDAAKEIAGVVPGGKQAVSVLDVGKAAVDLAKQSADDTKFNQLTISSKPNNAENNPIDTIVQEKNKKELKNKISGSQFFRKYLEILDEQKAPNPLQKLVDIDQQERNEYKKFVQDRAGGDWNKGAKLYAQLKNRPADDVFGEKERQTQFQNMQHDFNKFTPTEWKNYWLLSQHADNNVEFQQQALKNIETHLGQDNDHYRYLSDRVSVNTGHPQKYSTQNVISATPPARTIGMKGGGGSGGVAVSDTRDMQLGSELDPKRLMQQNQNYQ